MYDMHYDLLTILYYNYKKNNKKANLNKLIKDCYEIYNNNIRGGIINLFFESTIDMYKEYGITEKELTNVKEMFKKSILYLDYMKKKNIIPNDIDFIYSIEGCDYIENIEDLDELYKMGLRSILPVWNNKNKYASGNKTNKGLTIEGKKLIRKAINLGIIIDISHANEKSFHDILNNLENYNNYTLIASHSNVRKICNRDRNLDDDELKRLRDMNGYISLFTNSNFLIENNKELSYKERQLAYLKHLDYIIEKIGFSTNKILVATDDMNFHPNKKFHNSEAFPIKNISQQLYKLISSNYDENLAQNILINNPKRLIKLVK